MHREDRIPGVHAPPDPGPDNYSRGVIDLVLRLVPPSPEQHRPDPNLLRVQVGDVPGPVGGHLAPARRSREPLAVIDDPRVAPLLLNDPPELLQPGPAR